MAAPTAAVQTAAASAAIAMPLRIVVLLRSGWSINGRLFAAVAAVGSVEPLGRLAPNTAR